MSTTELAREGSGGTAIPVHFEITMDELLRMSCESATSQRGDWVRRLAAIGTAGLAIYFALKGDWLVAGLTALWAFMLLMRYRLMHRLIGIPLRGVVHCEAVIDQHGISGTMESRMRFQHLSEARRINYAWDRLRKIDRVSNCLIYEFHGGGGAIIPVNAFAEPDELRQCEAWAEHGLARGRTKPA